jgi:hypothetical protein
VSDLRARLRALRGEAPPSEDAAAPVPLRDARYAGPAAQLGAEVVEGPDGVHLRVRKRWPRGARHGATPVGGPGLAAPLRRWAERNAAVRTADGPVVYVDTETTGLSGGTGTYAFLVGVGVHEGDAFVVDQVVLPGPEHERGYLAALQERLAGAAAVVSYNGASFDLPLLRTRFALHGLDDPLTGVPHLDLLPLARRLWRERLPDCRLGTIEEHVLGARRSGRDVPGAEVPARYRAFLRSRDALPLRGVMEHNRDDVVALSALRSLLEARAVPGGGHDPDEALAWARWLEGAGDPAAALAHLAAVEAQHVEAAWLAGRLLRREGRTAEALVRWRRLADVGDPRGWIELAKHHEHRAGDLTAALEATEAARRAGGAAYDDLDRRRARLWARLGRSDG